MGPCNLIVIAFFFFFNMTEGAQAFRVVLAFTTFERGRKPKRRENRDPELPIELSI